MVYRYFTSLILDLMVFVKILLLFSLFFVFCYCSVGYFAIPVVVKKSYFISHHYRCAGCGAEGWW